MRRDFQPFALEALRGIEFEHAAIKETANRERGTTDMDELK
jgi:hypothetical protein